MQHRRSRREERDQRPTQQVGINELEQEEAPPGGAENVDEDATTSDYGVGRSILLWVVLVVGMVMLAIPVLWVIGVLAVFAPVAGGAPAWWVWLLATTGAAVIVLALWVAYRFAARVTEN